MILKYFKKISLFNVYSNIALYKITVILIHKQFKFTFYSCFNCLVNFFFKYVLEQYIKSRRLTVTSREPWVSLVSHAPRLTGGGKRIRIKNTLAKDANSWFQRINGKTYFKGGFKRRSRSLKNVVKVFQDFPNFQSYKAEREEIEFQWFIWDLSTKIKPDLISAC